MNLAPNSTRPYYIPRNYRVPASLIRNLEMKLSLDTSFQSRETRNLTNQAINTTINSP